MKDQEPHSEIGELLRADKPPVNPPPGLEARIILSIESSKRSRGHRFWPWLLVPSAAAIGIVMLHPIPQSQPPSVTKIEPPHTETVVTEVVEKHDTIAFFENPLDQEARALQRDIGRAGHFLINCLPSLSPESE